MLRSGREIVIRATVGCDVGSGYRERWFAMFHTEGKPLRFIDGPETRFWEASVEL